jgi:hypothetical protein
VPRSLPRRTTRRKRPPCRRDRVPRRMGPRGSSFSARNLGGSYRVARGRRRTAAGGGRVIARLAASRAGAVDRSAQRARPPTDGHAASHGAVRWGWVQSSALRTSLVGWPRLSIPDAPARGDPVQPGTLVLPASVVLSSYCRLLGIGALCGSHREATRPGPSPGPARTIQPEPDPLARRGWSRLASTRHRAAQRERRHPRPDSTAHRARAHVGRDAHPSRAGPSREGSARLSGTMHGQPAEGEAALARRTGRCRGRTYPRES